MKITLPQYTGKDNLVMLGVVPFFSILVNAIIFGYFFFTNWGVFLLASLITGVGFTIDFICSGIIAVSLKSRFPGESQLIKRLTYMMLTFLLLTGLFLYCLFRVYEAIAFFSLSFDESSFAWCYIFMGIVNIFITFLMEGIDRYNNWKIKREETEKLKKAYKKSQLQGLKSQLNQHFLFNSLNSLSSLIQEDEDKADKFLDEMTKVYRYMLRHDDEQLVSLRNEIKFLQSYRHLLKVRYGAGLELDIIVDEHQQDKSIPPLTLQVIVENAFTHNSMTKESPLKIEISSSGNGIIKIRNNVQLKSFTADLGRDEALDNVVQKYVLLANAVVRIEETDTRREIFLPLLTQKEMEETLA